MMQERNVRSGQGLSKVKDKDQQSISIDQLKLGRDHRKRKGEEDVREKVIIDLEEQSRSVSNIDKRKDRTRSRPST